MQTIGVIGAGQMGVGIAQVTAQAGFHVLLSDVSKERAEAGKAGIAKQLERLVTKEKIDAAAPSPTIGRTSCSVMARPG
jgi:3-hydroxybutyryl-CoA dehydrogenase